MAKMDLIPRRIIRSPLEKLSLALLAPSSQPLVLCYYHFPVDHQRL